jgi:hypothetical protein
MEFLEALLANPIILGVVILLAVVFIYGLVKRLFKLALIILLLLAGTVIWFKMTGQEVPEGLQGITEQGEKVIEVVVDKGGDLIKEGSEYVKKKADEKKDSN